MMTVLQIQSRRWTLPSSACSTCQRKAQTANMRWSCLHMPRCAPTCVTSSQRAVYIYMGKTGIRACAPCRECCCSCGTCETAANPVCTCSRNACQMTARVCLGHVTCLCVQFASCSRMCLLETRCSGRSGQFQFDFVDSVNDTACSCKRHLHAPLQFRRQLSHSRLLCSAVRVFCVRHVERPQSRPVCNCTRM